ncbi:MAG TPA: GNAT family N-acetyltransferase [Actinomycetota bacterium]|jgi:GNAT superfamily N-acetyltransferase|nr:GNAT family N-acetyltransferase [Actinomycetota bacterium]
MKLSPDLERISAFLSGMEDRAAEKITPVRGGVVLSDDRIPNIYFANQLRLAPDAGLTAGEAAAEAERAQGALKHRRITVHSEAAGQSLAPGLRALGWEVDRLAVMVQREPPDRPIKTRSVHELTRGGWKPFRRQMLEHEDMDPGVIQQMEDAEQRLIQSVGMRTFGVAVDGVVASCCDLFSDGATAQIEAVATLESHRNRGLARAVVWRTVEAARATSHDLIFLTASADDWPRQLYRRMGFRETGYFYEFLKVLPEASPQPAGSGATHSDQRTVRP